MAVMFYKRDAIDDGLPNPVGFTVVVVNSVLVALAGMLTICRFWSRISISHTFGPDDYCVLFSLLISITMTGLFDGESRNGFGLHQVDVNQEHFLQAWKYFLACQVLYKAAVCFSKMSMLILYYRIFQTRNFRIATYIVMFIVIGVAIGTILPTIFQCNPIEKAWIPSTPGQCIWTPGIWYAGSSLNIATDLMIILLPITQIPSLKLPKGQKIGLVAIFSLGIFIVGTCIVRITALGPAATAKDTTFYQAQNNLWLGIEVNTSIICTCIPPLRAPVAKLFPRLFGGSSYHRPSNYDRSHTGAIPIESTKDRSFHRSRGSMIHPNPINPKTAYTTTTIVGAASSSDADSDKVFMLRDMGKAGDVHNDDRIMKKTDIEVSYVEVP